MVDFRVEDAAAVDRNGVRIVPYNSSSEKGYTVSLISHPEVELSLYQEYGDSRWYDPHLRIGSSTDDEPLARGCESIVFFLLGVSASVMTHMAQYPLLPCTPERFYAESRYI